MFKCDACNNDAPPAVKPILKVTATRLVEYKNEFFREDEYGNREKVKVESTGTEIVTEKKLCLNCANDKFAMNLTADPVPATERWTGGFQEKPADPFVRPLIDVALNNWLSALNGNKRAKKQAEGVAPLIKEFIENNKEVVA